MLIFIRSLLFFKIRNPEEDEVEIVHDTEALKKAFHDVKLLQFHTDFRPPYYGTWRKSTSLNPRNPWYKDEVCGFSLFF